MYLFLLSDFKAIDAQRLFQYLLPNILRFHLKNIKTFIFTALSKKKSTIKHIMLFKKNRFFLISYLIFTTQNWMTTSLDLIKKYRVIKYIKYFKKYDLFFESHNL